MLDSEGIRRFIALVAVAAAVGAQSFVTRNVVADQRRQANDFGVRLLGTDRLAPVSPMARSLLALPPPAAESTNSAATFLASTKEPTMLNRVHERERSWLAIPLPELQRRDFGADPLRSGRLPHRDSAGSLVELSENDVLIPAPFTY